MFFGKKIRELREQKGFVLRKVAAQLDVDTATLSKIELGDRHAKREYLEILSKLYDIDHQELERLWLADKVYYIIQDEEQGLSVLKEAETAYRKLNNVFK